MNRRHFITLRGGGAAAASAWPLATRAQRAMPVVALGINVPLPLLGRADEVIE